MKNSYSNKDIEELQNMTNEELYKYREFFEKNYIFLIKYRKEYKTLCEVINQRELPFEKERQSMNVIKVKNGELNHFFSLFKNTTYIEKPILGKILFSYNYKDIGLLKLLIRAIFKLFLIAFLIFFSSFFLFLFDNETHWIAWVVAVIPYIFVIMLLIGSVLRIFLFNEVIITSDIIAIRKNANKFLFCSEITNIYKVEYIFKEEITTTNYVATSKNLIQKIAIYTKNNQLLILTFNESFFGGGDIPVGDFIVDLLNLLNPEIETKCNDNIPNF